MTALQNEVRTAVRVRPLLRAGGIIYVSLLLVFIAYPQAVLTWLDDFEPNVVVTAARPVVVAISRLSRATGLYAVSAAVRAEAQAIARRSDSSRP